jgi:hypothetical protein
MSRSSNTLRASDVITTPIKLKYSSSYESTTFASYGIEVLKGVNGPVTTTGSVPQATLNYYSIRHLFYSNFLTGSFPVSASYADNFLQSTAASGTLDADLRYFPTESNAEITIFSIPRQVFGQQISRQSFNLSSSAYYIIDDGNGNLLDQTTQIYVGNVIYPQGIAIITNPNYQVYFPGCKNYTVTYVGGGGDLFFEYTDCTGSYVLVESITSGATTFCAESGSVNVLSGNYTLTDNGYCP